MVPVQLTEPDEKLRLEVEKATREVFDMLYAMPEDQKPPDIPTWPPYSISVLPDGSARLIAPQKSP